MTYETTKLPTKVGDRIRIVCYGGKVRSWMVDQTGVVIRFTTKGSPVIALDDSATVVAWSGGNVVVTDRFGCARLVNEDGSLARP